jgi:hypothetical protein
MGLEMTTAIINEERYRAGLLGVGKTTVSRCAKREFGGRCHNRQTEKTGSKDVESTWAKARLALAIQLQQQFRVDKPGQPMIRKVVVKLFEGGIEYMGNITDYNARRQWYHVVYSDGDEEDLTYKELRVPSWVQIDRSAVLWLDEKHKKVVLGSASRHEWLFFVDPDDPDKLLRREEGGVLEEEKPNTVGKFMSECRGLFGVMMCEDADGTLRGMRMKPFDYTQQKVIGPAAFEKAVQAEVMRVAALKTTGTPRSKFWKQAGKQLPGGPYEAKFGSSWRKEVVAKLGRGNSAICNVTDLQDHAIQCGNELFANTPFKNTWVIYHDALSAWWSEQEHRNTWQKKDLHIDKFAALDTRIKTKGLLVSFLVTHLNTCRLILIYFPTLSAVFAGMSRQQDSWNEMTPTNFL